MRERDLGLMHPRRSEKGIVQLYTGAYLHHGQIYYSCNYSTTKLSYHWGIRRKEQSTCRMIANSILVNGMAQRQHRSI